MRCVARTLLLAAVLAVAGCSLSRDSYSQIAEITSITTPDTVRAGETFSTSFHAILGNHTAYQLDHIDSLRADSSLAVRIWSLDVSNGRYVGWMIMECDYAFTASAATPNTFCVIAHQPDGSTTQKTITVLP